MAGFDKYVKSLLHCNEDNLSKLINDEVKSNIWQTRGQPRISRENARFNSFYYFDSGKLTSFRLYKKIPLGADRDFTLDFWLYNKDRHSSGTILEFYNNEVFSRISLSIEDNMLKIYCIGEELYQSECFIDLDMEKLTHLGIICYSEISRLYIYKNGEKQHTLIFKIPEGDYNVVFGSETKLSNLNLGIGEIRMSNFRRWNSSFLSNLDKEFVLDDKDIFFLKFKESIVDFSKVSQGFSVVSGYHEIVKVNSPFKNSLYLSGDSRLESNREIELGGKDFCIDGWVYIENISDNILSSIFEFENVKLLFNNLESTLKFQINNDYYPLSGIWSGILFHFALVFKLSDNNSLTLYLNGQSVLRVEDVDLFNNVCFDKFIYGNNLKCYLSELRISYGIARFIGDFKLAKLPYSEDTFNKSTEVLLHLNQTSLLDKGGNDWRLIDELVYFTNEGAKLSKAVEFYKNRQYLYLSELALGVSDFTIEFWTTSKFYDYNYKYLNYFKDSQGTLVYLINNNNSQTISLSVIKDNFYRLILLIDSVKYVWNFKADFNNLYHIAIEYILNENSIKLYLNGHQVIYQNDLYKLTLDRAITPDKFRVYLGNNSLGNDFYQGTFNDFRISNILRYSEEFIPDKRELIPDSYVLSLLHLESSVFQDLANNEWILIQDSYKKSLLVNNSIAFGKALKLYKHQYLKMNGILYLGGQDFTLDLFIKMSFFIENNGNIFELLNLNNNFNLSLRRYKDTQGICLRIGVIPNDYRELIFDEDNLLNMFCHLALVYRNDLNELKLYINGFEKGSINYPIERQAFDFITLGKSYLNKEGYFEGIVDEFRIIDGIALWIKKSFELPVKESNYLSNIDRYTESLLHFDESATKDESGKQWLAEGISSGVKLSSLQYKFPYQSAYFDGRSSIKLLNKLELGDSDFLIDFYISLEKLSQGSMTKIFQIYNNQFTLENAIHCYIDNESRYLCVTINYSDKIKSRSQIAYNQFYRVSILFKRDFNMFVLYINDSEEDVVYYNMKFTIYANLVIGHSGSDTSYYHWYNSFFTGYIDRFMITTDIDRFTIRDNGFYLDGSKLYVPDNYTKSLLQFKDYRLRDTYKEGNWNNTWNLKGDSVLLHLDESFLDSFVTNNWELTGNPIIRACPKFLFPDESISYAYYNNGKDFNYLSNNGVNLDKIFNNDFTLDFWVYLENIEHNQGFISSNMSEYYWEGFVIFCANKNLRFSAKFNDTWKELDFFRLEENRWIHIALVRKENILFGYKDGILKNTFEIGTLQGIESQLNIGYWYRTGTGYGGLLEGYLREIRITKTAIWTENTFSIPSSKNDSFYLIKDNPLKNSLTLMKDQYLEKDIPVKLINDFTIEAYISLEENQAFFLLEGLTDRLTIKSLQQDLLLLIINDKTYKISIEDIEYTVHHIAIEYIRERLMINVYVDSRLEREIDQIELIDLEFKIFIGKGINEANGIKLINEFRILSTIRSRYLLKEQNILPLVTEEDLVLLLFKEDVTKDEVALNQWKIEGERRIIPEIVKGEDYFSYSRFGKCLYLFRSTYLRMVDIKGLTLGGKDFSIESWVYLLGDSVLFSARNIFSGNKLVVRLTRSSIVIQIDENELRIEIELNDLFHIAIEYQNINKLLSVYINGKEVSELRSLEILEIQYDVVNIGFDSELGSSHMYLDEFRISKGIARWRGNFLLETQPYSLLSYNKKLVIRDRKSGQMEYIPLYYDIPEKGYTIFDSESGVEVYAGLSNLDNTYLYSNLISRINNKKYILPRESIKVYKGLDYFYRFDKNKNILEYSTNGIEGYKSIKSLLGSSISLSEFNPVLILREDIIENNLEDYTDIYKNVISDTEDFTYYQLSFIKLNSDSNIYLSYRIKEDSLELILDKKGLGYRILGEDNIEFIDNISIRIIGDTEIESMEELNSVDLNYKILSNDSAITGRIIEFAIIGEDLCYRVVDSNNFTMDLDKLGYIVEGNKIEFIIDGEILDYRVVGEKGVEFSVKGDKLVYNILDRSPLEVIGFDFDEQIIQLYLILSDYWGE